MCARFGLSVPHEDLERFLGLELPFETPPASNIAPTENTVALVRSPDGATARLLRWGLIPPWAEGPAVGARMINARSETVTEKGAFKPAFEKRRCIIPASGFFEWQDVYPQTELFEEAPKGKPLKQPLFFHRKDWQLLAFAGLWETWRSKDRETTLHTFTILTTQANELMRPIHDRMPVLLPRDSFELWLSDANQQDLLEMLKPAPSAELGYYPVTPRMNNPRYKEADALVPLG